MSIPIWKIFQIFGVVSAWSFKALEDGKITLVEAAELGMQLAPIIGVEAQLQLPPPETLPTEEPGPSETAQEQPPHDKPPHKPLSGYTT